MSDTVELVPDSAEALRYERRKLIASLISIVIGVLAPLLFLLLDGSEGLRDLIEDWTTSPYAGVAIFLLIAGGALQLIDLPLEIYTGYVLERQFKLGRIGRRQWTMDWLKGLALQLVFALAVAEGVYLALRELPDTWWLVSAAGLVLFSVVLTALAPILLFRIFFKFEPLPEGELSDRLLALSERLRVPVRGVYLWKLGEKTRKANAALAGWGPTRRILLSDTLVNEHSIDEIEVVVAHEMGHQVHFDIWRGLAVQTALIFVSLFAVHLALEAWTEPLGLRDTADFANMPLLVLIMTAVALIALPLANGYSRYAERSADRFALVSTGMRDEFISAMSRLAEQNLTRKRPNRVVELIFHSHPSVQRRIEFARDWQAENTS